jgi:hypothetical protein
MKKWKKWVLGIVVVFILLTAAHFGLRSFDQTFTKRWGGSMTINLDTGERLEMITWKEGEHLWYQTRARTPEESPTVHKFREYSRYGVLQGEVVIKER